MLEEEINIYFNFLETEYFFKKLPEYNFVREVHNDFIKDNIIVKIIYEGDYYLKIIILNSIDMNLLNFSKKSIELKKYEYKSYYLHELIKIRENTLNELSIIVKENHEILNGNFDKLKFKNNLFWK